MPLKFYSARLSRLIEHWDSAHPENCSIWVKAEAVCSLVSHGQRAPQIITTNGIVVHDDPEMIKAVAEHEADILVDLLEAAGVTNVVPWQVRQDVFASL